MLVDAYLNGKKKKMNECQLICNDSVRDRFLFIFSAHPSKLKV